MGLTLSRKCGEKIIIGETISVQVIDIQGDRVRLDIVAPRRVNIRREELLPLEDEK